MITVTGWWCGRQQLHYGRPGQKIKVSRQLWDTRNIQEESDQPQCEETKDDKVIIADTWIKKLYLIL